MLKPLQKCYFWIFFGFNSLYGRFSSLSENILLRNFICLFKKIRYRENSLSRSSLHRGPTIFAIKSRYLSLNCTIFNHNSLKMQYLQETLISNSYVWRFKHVHSKGSIVFTHIDTRGRGCISTGMLVHTCRLSTGTLVHTCRLYKSTFQL